MQRQLKLKGGIYRGGHSGMRAEPAEGERTASSTKPSGAVIMLLVRSLRSVMLLYT